MEILCVFASDVFMEGHLSFLRCMCVCLYLLLLCSSMCESCFWFSTVEAKARPGFGSV